MAKKRGARVGFMKRDVKGQNDDKTQIHLDKGSAEHQEYVMDQQGMTEIEQERYKREDAGLVQCDPFQPEDRWHADEAAEAATVLPGLDGKHRDKQKFHYDHTVERKQNRRILKGLLIDDAEAQAVQLAQSTETTADDKQVENLSRRLPKSELIHDDGVMVDEFVPKALQKYM